MEVPNGDNHRIIIINLIFQLILLVGISASASSLRPTECKYPPTESLFGMVDVVSKHTTSVLQFNERIKVRCKDTYYDIGEMRIICAGENLYYYPQPWCKEAYCPSPEAPSHGHLHPPAKSYPAKAQVNITCDEGYRYSGNPTITCQRNREWDEAVGRCIKIKCPAIRRPHSTLQTQPPYYYNVSLPVRCKEGHYYTGDDSATCGYDSQWTRPIGFCERVTCNWPHTTLKNGSIRECRPCHYKDQLQITCDEGHEYTDPPIMCGQDGSWNTSEMGSCEPVGCGKLPSVFLGHVRRVNASVASVSCVDSTYIEMEGHNAIHCNKNGSWTKLPTCKLVWNVKHHMITLLGIITGCVIIIIITSMTYTIRIYRRKTIIQKRSIFSHKGYYPTAKTEISNNEKVPKVHMQTPDIC